MNLLLRKLIARLLNPFYPGYGTCYRCQRNWLIARAHVTNFTPDSGCFPLCEACWGELTPQERLPYYVALWQDWNESEEEDKQTLTLIEQAVRNGQ